MTNSRSNSSIAFHRPNHFHMHETGMAAFVGIRLHGGLGNKLFQLLFAKAFALRHGKELKIVQIEPNRHSEVDYFNNIFASFASAIDEKAAKDVYAQVYEDPMGPWKHVVYQPKDVPTLYHGYFQTAKHFEDNISREDILEWLGLARGTVPSKVLSLYPGVSEGAFIHVRRGDYLTHDHIVHHIDLHKYYENALKLFDERCAHTKWPLFVVSDDIAHCKSMPEFKARERITFVDLDEVETLCLMTLCRLGGIAANSTFSWFGAYLNPCENKLVTLPKPWWTLAGYDTDDLYFRGATVLSV